MIHGNCEFTKITLEAFQLRGQQQRAAVKAFDGPDAYIEECTQFFVMEPVHVIDGGIDIEDLWVAGPFHTLEEATDSWEALIDQHPNARVWEFHSTPIPEQMDAKENQRLVHPVVTGWKRPYSKPRSEVAGTGFVV